MREGLVEHNILEAAQVKEKRGMCWLLRVLKPENTTQSKSDR